MKILYGIQGTGHGHISRAREIVPYLSEEYDIDLLVSGYNTKLSIEHPVRYRYKGLSFVYKKGGVAILDSLRNLNVSRFYKDVRSLKLNEYDLVISDFEPVSAWAARRQSVPSLNMSHQAAFISQKTPRPSKVNALAEQVIRHFAPCDEALGFHFEKYDDFIMSPIIRSEVRELQPYKAKHVTVYLPAYPVDELTELFRRLDFVDWQIFTPYVDTDEVSGNVHFIPIDNKRFLASLEGCLGLVTSSGFESCAEALYLKKKLFSIPIQNQYEQYCNAAALKQMDVDVIDYPATKREVGEGIEYWLQNDKQPVLPNYCTAKDVYQHLNGKM